MAASATGASVTGLVGAGVGAAVSIAVASSALMQLVRQNLTSAVTDPVFVGHWFFY
jgi:hypothetical protein